jgi:hypothetical protein
MCKTQHSQTTLNKAKPPVNNNVHFNQINYTISKPYPEVIASKHRYLMRIVGSVGYTNAR